MGKRRLRDFSFVEPARRTKLQIECADNVMQMTLFLFAGAGLRRCFATPDFLLDNLPTADIEAHADGLRIVDHNVARRLRLCG
jgi:hypothetical protein